MAITLEVGKVRFLPCMKHQCFALTALGLCDRTWAFSSCDEQTLLFVAVHRLLIVLAWVTNSKIRSLAALPECFPSISYILRFSSFNLNQVKEL